MSLKKITIEADGTTFGIQVHDDNRPGDPSIELFSDADEIIDNVGKTYMSVNAAKCLQYALAAATED